MERDAFLGHNGKSFVRMELVKVSGFSRLHNSFVFIARFYVYSETVPRSIVSDPADLTPPPPLDIAAIKFHLLLFAI